MLEKIIFAGFGGQGVILSGKLICVAALEENKHVTHIPSYGAEMRGGTANCSVVISDDEIGSPLIPAPTICVVMNKPSLLKFEPRIVPGGLLIYNSSLIEIKPQRKDITAVPVKANDLAVEAGNVKAANMIIIGLLLKLKPHLASLESALDAVSEVVSSRNKELNELNKICIKKGYELV